MIGDWSGPAPAESPPGELLADPGWLGQRIDDAGRFWRTPERATLATLWWYSASVVLLGPSLHALATTGRATSVMPADLLVTLTPYGFLQAVRPAQDAPDLPDGPAALGAHLDQALARIIAPLASTGGLRQARLWALAADAIGTRLIAERQTALAPLIGAGSQRLRPHPRFLPMASGPSGTGVPLVLLQRGSCCMLFRVPRQAMCISCPRQLPQDRLARMAAYARSTGG